MSSQAQNLGLLHVPHEIILNHHQRKHEVFKSMLSAFHHFLLYSVRRPDSVDSEAARFILWDQLRDLKSLEDITNSVSFPTVFELDSHVHHFVAIFRLLKRLRGFYHETLNFLDHIPEPESINTEIEFEVQQQFRRILAKCHHILVAPRAATATAISPTPPPLYPPVVNNPSPAPDTSQFDVNEGVEVISQSPDNEVNEDTSDSPKASPKEITEEITEEIIDAPQAPSSDPSPVTTDPSSSTTLKKDDHPPISDGEAQVCPLHSVSLVHQPHIRDDVCVCVGILYPNGEFHCRTSGECCVVNVAPEDMQKLGSSKTEAHLYSVYLIPVVAYQKSDRIALLTVDKEKYMLLGRDLGVPPPVHGLRSAVAFAARYGVPKSDRANARKKKNVDIHYYYMFKRIWETQSKEKNPKSMAITTKDGRFRCYVCFKEFTSSENCNRHARSHEGDQIFVCDFCHTSFTRFDALQRHYEHNRCRPDECQIVCRHCSRQFFNSKLLEKHMESVKEIQDEAPRESSRKKVAR